MGNYHSTVGGSYVKYKLWQTGRRIPIRLSKPITIGEVSHPAGAYLYTDDDTAIRQLGYKPITRTIMPTRDGYYYTEKWTETETAIVQEWEEHEQRPA